MAGGDCLFPLLGLCLNVAGRCGGPSLFLMFFFCRGLWSGGEDVAVPLSLLYCFLGLCVAGRCGGGLKP